MKLIIAVSVLIFSIALAVSTAFAHGWCWACTEDTTYGWHVMSPDERKEHQIRIVNFTDFKACKDYVDAHAKKMAERAGEKGIVLPVVRENPCDVLKDKGLLK